MEPASPARVLISYARADGETPAHDLRQRLVAAARRRAAFQLACDGRFDAALDALKSQQLDHWVESIGSMMGSFESRTPGLGRSALSEALRIVGWVRPDWAPFEGIVR